MNSEEIKLLHKMPEILRKYGVKVQKDRALCFAHTEKTPSLKIKDDYCHCFGCGWHGDIFAVTMFFENCDFKTAIDILGGNKKPSLTAHRKAKAVIKERAKAQKEAEEKSRLYWRAMDEWIRLDNNKRDYVPKIYKNLDISKLTDIEFQNLMQKAGHSLYVEACQKITQQEFEVLCLS